VSDGAPRVRFVLGRAAVVALAVGVALFGSFLLVITPRLSSSPGLQVVWVIFALVLLKVPLLGMVWWLIAHRRRSRQVRWSEPETRRFLDAVADEAVRVAGLPDAAERFDALRADAWRAVEEGDDALTPAAVELALRLDRDRRRDGHSGRLEESFRN